MKGAFFLTIAGIGLILVGCTTSGTGTTASQQSITKEFRIDAIAEKQDGYKLQYPQNWIIANEINELDLILSPKKFELVQNPGKEENAIFVVAASQKASSPLDLSEKLKIIIQKGSPNAVITISQLTLNGYEAARLDAKNVKVALGIPVQTILSSKFPGLPGNYIEVVIDGPKTRFRISFTYLEDDEKSRRLLNEIVQSFTVLE